MGVAALSMLTLLGVATTPTALAAAHHAKAVHAKHVTVHDPVIYNSIVSPLPGSLESTAFEATQTSEYGNQIAFAGTARVLDTVAVTMDSFVCQTGGSFSLACLTTPGATFSEPITLNVYNVGPNNSVGSLITTDTQTFAIPYQPSADPNYATDCLPNVTPSFPISSFAGSWYDPNPDPVTGLPIGCLVGYAANITFNFGHVVLPNSIIYGIAYNTSGYGFNPYGNNTPCALSANGCGYDGLNVANSESPDNPTVGSDPNLGTAYLDTSYGPFYCDNGAGGIGTFRIDGRPDTNNCTSTAPAYNVGYSYSAAQGLCPAAYPGGQDDAVALTGIPPCTVSPYIIPAVQFNAVNSPSPSFTSPAAANVVAGTPFSFTITTTGVPVPIVSQVGRKLPKGLTFHNNGDGTATISGTATVRNIDKNYSVVIKARNARNSSAKQRLILTLTGGRA